MKVIKMNEFTTRLFNDRLGGQSAAALCRPGRPVVFLRLEEIGANVRLSPDRAFHAALRPGLAALARLHLLLPNRRPWCARLLGLDATYVYQREFLRPRRDYTEANSKGSRGIYLYFNLYEGEVYEVHELVSWSRDRRYFASASAGKVFELDEVEVRRRIGCQP